MASRGTSGKTAGDYAGSGGGRTATSGTTKRGGKGSGRGNPATPVVPTIAPPPRADPSGPLTTIINRPVMDPSQATSWTSLINMVSRRRGTQNLIGGI